MHRLRVWRLTWWLVAAVFAVPVVVFVLLGQGENTVAGNENSWTAGRRLRPEAMWADLPRTAVWRDRFGDGWPDAARLETPADRDNFIRWMTYLAESLYYQPGQRSRGEVQDCAGLIRYAYRNALIAHTPAWHQTSGLLGEPRFADVTQFNYPAWPLGRNLFRTVPGPLAPDDLERGAFQEFADARTLLQFNSFLISRDIRAARGGDLLFFQQPEQAEPLHAMLFVGRSHFQPEAADWIVYHTGDLDGRRGAVRHVQASVLARHPEPRWRPYEVNPRFLGVYRLNLLR